MKRIASALFLGSAAAVGAAETREIPAGFLGVWDSSAEDCAKTYSESRVTIKPTKLVFWESVAEVTSIELKAKDDVVLSLNSSGEGETWTSTMHFQLSKTGDLMEISRGSAVVWVRCSRPRT